MKKTGISRGWLGVLVVALIAGLIAAPVGAAPPARQTALRIGYLGLANSEGANGAQLAIDQINGAGGFTAADGTAYLLELITLAAPPTAETLTNNLTALQAQDVVAVLGPETGATLTAANLESLINTGLPVLTGAVADTLTDNDTADVIFRVRAPSRVYSEALAAYMTGDLGLTAIALVSTDPEAAEALSDFEQALGAQGIRAAGKLQLPNATFLEDQAQGLIALNPEALAMWGPPEDALALLMLLRESGWTGQFAYRHADEAARAGTLPDELAEGVLGVSCWSYAYTDRASRVFLDDYLVTFGVVPGPLSAAMYDAVWALRAAMVSEGTGVEAIRAGLLSLAPIELVQGVLRPAAFANGDIARMAMVYVLGPGGGPTVVTVFDDTQRQTLVDVGNQ